MRKRYHAVMFYINDEELTMLKQKMRESGLSKSAFLRSLILNDNVKLIQPDAVKDLRRQIRGVGRNVNQIARLAHISGKVSHETLQEIAAAQERIEKQLEGLR